MKRYVMSLDQGTTSSRAILFDEGGNVCQMAQKEFKQYYPQPGWAEHDPEEIYESQLAVARTVIEQLGITAEQIAAIGITNQRETTIIWDKETGKPIYRAIVWQCRRTTPMIEEIPEAVRTYIQETTGLIPDAYFSASKIKWLLDHVKGAREAAEQGKLMFGTVDTWLIWKLTQGKAFVTDYSNASRTMMYDIHRLKWDEQILKYFAVPEVMLPDVCPSSCVYGHTEAFGDVIPVAGAAGDQQAALFGQCCFGAGEVKNTYGTGCFLLMNTGKTPIHSHTGLLTTIAASCGDEVEYAMEGSVFMAGASIQWLRDEMKLLSNAKESEAVARQVKDTDGVYIVPAFTGLGAPYWNSFTRGMIVGMTRGSGRAHLVRATLESIAYQTYDVLKAMEEDLGYAITSVKADGGAASNSLLMQFQADILGSQVEIPESLETTALGAAYLAGLAVGYWQDKEQIKANWKRGKVYAPSQDDMWIHDHMKGWKRAVRAALAWSTDEDEVSK